MANRFGGWGSTRAMSRLSGQSPKPRRKKAAIAVNVLKQATEKSVHNDVCYLLSGLKWNDSKWDYRTDLSGMPFPPSILRKIWPSRFNANAADLQSTNGWPDIQINYDGLPTLYLELKKDGVKLRNKKGLWANAHLAEQAYMLRKLRSSGSFAVFAIGYAEAKEIIEAYAKGQNVNEISQHLLS